METEKKKKTIQWLVETTALHQLLSSLFSHLLRLFGDHKGLACRDDSLVNGVLQSTPWKRTRGDDAV